MTKTQNQLRDRCVYVGPKGGRYVIPGTEDVRDNLARFRYDNATLRIIEDNIERVRRAYCAKNGIPYQVPEPIVT